MKKENKLIAEFMGMEESNGEYYRRIYNSGDWIPLNDLEFDTSWEWLIPVVEKINGIKYEANEELDQRIIIVLRAVLSFDRSQVYKAVVDFINEHNKNK